MCPVDNHLVHDTMELFIKTNTGIENNFRNILGNIYLLLQVLQQYLFDMVFKCQEDSFLREYVSKVVSCEPSIINITKNGKVEDIAGYDVVLENTILFPEGGGQPSDTGYLDDSRVYQVVRRGEKAIHQVDREFEVGKLVKQTIDWKRREDHMQQHSGQHLISAIFEKEHKMTTISWWLGEEVSYIELENVSVKSDLLAEVEKEANCKIQAGLKVYVTLIDSNTPSEELIQVQSRKGLPSDHVGDIRIINIEGVDSNMCCGTHVNNTCQLQAIKLLYAEKSKRKNNTLVYFLCGKRVLKKLDECLCREQKLTAVLKTNPVSHVELVEKLQKNVKLLSKQLQGAVRNIASYEAEKLKRSDPTPKYYFLHRKDTGPEFMSVFIQELGREDIFLFLSTDEGNKNGNIVLYGPMDLVQRFGPKVCEILNGKGAGKGNRFQAKVSDITSISKVEKLIEEDFAAI